MNEVSMTHVRAYSEGGESIMDLFYWIALIIGVVVLVVWLIFREMNAETYRSGALDRQLAEAPDRDPREAVAQFEAPLGIVEVAELAQARGFALVTDGEGLFLEDTRYQTLANRRCNLTWMEASEGEWLKVLARARNTIRARV